MQFVIPSIAIAFASAPLSAFNYDTWRFPLVQWLFYATVIVCLYYAMLFFRKGVGGITDKIYYALLPISLAAIQAELLIVATSLDTGTSPNIKSSSSLWISRLRRGALGPGEAGNRIEVMGWVVRAFLIIGGLIAFGLSHLVEPLYRAQPQILLSAPRTASPASWAPDLDSSRARALRAMDGRVALLPARSGSGMEGRVP